MFTVNGIEYENDEMGKKVGEYMSKGFDRRTAEYFAHGRRRISSIAARDDFSLQIIFDSSEVRILDCKPFLKEGTVFAPFMELKNFKRVYLDDSHCIAWDIDPAVDSEKVWSNKVDLCPDTCYLDSVPS